MESASVTVLQSGQNGVPNSAAYDGENKSYVSGNIYGFHFGNSMHSLASHPSVSIWQYCHQLSYNLNSFTNLKTNNKYSD